MKASKTHIETNLAHIASYAATHLEENDRFRELINQLDSTQIDQLVGELASAISPKISCTDCGNCCKSLMVLINEDEANHLADHLGKSRSQFDKDFLEKGSNGLMIMNRMPCPFLAENKCTVYEHRFEGCKEFPALDLPHFKRRLFTTYMHYDRCPIIFNVVEQLKQELGFQNQ